MRNLNVREPINELRADPYKPPFFAVFFYIGYNVPYIAEQYYSKAAIFLLCLSLYTVKEHPTYAVFVGASAALGTSVALAEIGFFSAVDALSVVADNPSLSPTSQATLTP